MDLQVQDINSGKGQLIVLEGGGRPPGRYEDHKVTLLGVRHLARRLARQSATGDRRLTWHSAIGVWRLATNVNKIAMTYSRLLDHLEWLGSPIGLYYSLHETPTGTLANRQVTKRRSPITGPNADRRPKRQIPAKRFNPPPPFRGCFLFVFLLVSIWKFPRTWTLTPPPFEQFWPRPPPPSYSSQRMHNVYCYSTLFDLREL